MTHTRFVVLLALLGCADAVIVNGAEPILVKEKTLVAWVAPANLTQRGGSALSIDDQQGHFDGIVLGEKSAGKWMAGSDYYRRTAGQQTASPAETADTSTLVQIAIVYRDKDVTIYRDGKEYSRYQVKGVQEFGKDAAVVIGLRHLESHDGACFAGAIDDARLYSFALTAGQIAALKPNEPSDPKPMAWWNFQNGKAQDAMGVFPEARLVGGARVVDGKLVLDGNGSYMVTPPTASAASPRAAPRPDAKARPTYHFTSPSGKDCMPFDPNGGIFYKGRYHLGFIYQEGGKHYWGHASTTDFIHWRIHPPMLSPGPEKGIFSGNAFVDRKGRVVLSYHGLGLGGNCLAVAQDDDLNVFKKLETNPVMKNPGWDPHTWLEGDTYYSISGGNPGSGKVASLYTSTDETLAKWTLLGPLMSKDMPDVFPNEDISCPDLFKLGDKHILLCISHVRGARYYVGRFENNQFHPDAHYRMNWPGGTCFAPETLLDDKGRRIMWAWVLGSPSTMTLPRVLSMGADGVMKIEPVEELNALRRNPQSLKDVDVPADTNVAARDIVGDCKELRITIDPQQAAQCGVKVRRSPDGVEETAVTYDSARKVLSVGMEKSSLNRNTKPRTYAMTFMLPRGAENSEVSAQEAPFELKPGEMLNLRIYLDHSIMEVFANGRQCVTQRVWPTRDDSTGVSFFSRGGGAKVKSLEAWDLSATSFDAPGLPQTTATPSSQGGTITYESGEGAGKGKHIVFVCGEWEYRCEESLPMLAEILAKRHGFKCTVLFSMNPKDGTVDPSVKNNIPGMSVLKSADMMVLFAMDLTLPDEQMKHFVEFLETGKPVMGIRCSLLSFRYDKKSPYARYDVGNGGYAAALFGESWKGHYGVHGKESTRGVRSELNEKHPILNGVRDVWGPTDVYRITKLPEDATVLMYGQVLEGMKPEDRPNLQKSVMPMVWTREIKRDSGAVSRVVVSTIGAAQDMESEDLRRLYVNSIYWSVGLEASIPEKADVSYIGGEWKASPFGGGKFRHGLKPEDFAVQSQGKSETQKSR